MTAPGREADDASPFHPAEQAVQSRLGVRDAVEPRARQVIRSFLPEQHREFYKQLPFLVVAARDASGRPWATLLTGNPGFISTPDPKRLHIAASLPPGDALEGSLIAGTELGVLGIELVTRRRNRVNGRIGEAGGSGLALDVVQSFGNCPKYITARPWRQVDAMAATSPAVRSQRLTSRMRGWIGSADSLFLASGYQGTGQHPAHGMDASHRGGAAGFVKVIDDARLILPDYSGNNHFNTIGNLIADPQVGLLFVDFDHGDLLQISGKATIDWDSVEVATHPGAQRLITIDIEQIVQLDGVLSLRWAAAQSPPTAR